MTAPNLSETATLIEDCEKRESRLTDWERTFIDSVGRQVAAGRALTVTQHATLDDIWNKATERG